MQNEQQIPRRPKDGLTRDDNVKKKAKERAKRTADPSSAKCGLARDDNVKMERKQQAVRASTRDSVRDNNIKKKANGRNAKESSSRLAVSLLGSVHSWIMQWIATTASTYLPAGRAACTPE